MANVYNKPIIISGGGSDEIPVDNGPIYEGKYRVRYFDLDGTILKIEYVANGGRTTPPQAPVYDPDYLIFDEWNYDIANYIVERPTDIGATYDTVGNATYMWCKFTTKTGLNPTLGVSGFTSIDWGDGTIDTNTSHTYAKEGNYLIKISGDISFTGTDSFTYICGSNNLNKALQKCYIKKGMTSISTYRFDGCYSLTTISMPNSITSIGTNVFVNCQSLTNIIIPKYITSLSDYIFSYCYSLVTISLPDGITTINEAVFRNNASLNELIISKFVTSIGANVFNANRSLTNYFICSDTVPVLANTNAFSSINYSTTIWVNDSIIEELKVADKWSTYANYMKPLSWYPSLTDPNPPTGYTLTLNCNPGVLNSEVYLYSVDDGATWDQFTNSEIVLQDVSKIKFENGSVFYELNIGSSPNTYDIAFLTQGMRSDNINVNSNTTFYISISGGGAN